ncbi:molybdopterin oxidoreductase family protein [Streptomyces sp. NBC_01795]|nr:MULTISPECIES: molybdopterin oxidoreductase family protein [unclassified Streptomyces]WSA97379.1 molybdopterin oxidoreductase family protein [Streptomyces sp. NBC_01795]WSB81808.1 molybdopterin oxidoreductase family protein [Streptomyces sp. NBC_01775]WSS17427.1 molybdopterin oxidoreductase family protein [Streptomyces sp. NBC_01186]WSS46175.1 molybdopterin oxidoreductase family protein [Streptomyces sp. NBC_01187]
MTLTPGGTPGTLDVTPRDFPTNAGGLCQKGWTSASLLTSPERLTTPLVRDASGALREAGWDEALDLVARGMERARDSRGPDAVAVFGSGGLTNEKAYALGKFARVALGTSQIDYNGRFCMSSAAAAGNRAFGLDRGLPFPVTDLDASEAVVLVGANPAETMPPLMGHLDPARLIVVDPRRTATAQAALDGGGLHLQPAPGTDLALALGLLHVALVDGHLEAPGRVAYRRERTTGWDEARRCAARWWPERTERLTGVAAADLRKAVGVLAGAHRAHILTGRGAEQHSKGVDTVAAWINLALALGLPGTPGSGYGCLTGQGNGQGGREHGQKADQLPGYRHISDPAARAHIASVWDVPEESLPGPGRSAWELLDALGTPDGPSALLVMGSNPAVSAPRSRRAVERLRALDLLVVADFVRSETAELADVVLPVTMWAEESGTMTSLEGRVLRRHRAQAPPPGVRTDLEVLHGLAVRLGRGGAEFPVDHAEVFEELRRASEGGTADYSGVRPEALDAGEAVHWPAPRGQRGSGTPHLFLDRFAHPEGKARFLPVEHREAAELPDAAHPLYATTGRELQHYQSGAQTRRVPELAAAAPGAYVEVHPDTARRAGLADGDQARVVSRRGSVLARTRCVPTLRTDTVFLPFHYAGTGTANALTNPALDPVSRMPEFKLCAVRLEPAGAGDRGADDRGADHPRAVSP